MRHDHDTHITLGILIRKKVQDENDEYNNVQQYGVHYFLAMDIHNLCFSHPFNVIVAMMKNDAIGGSSKRLSQTATSFRQLVQTVTSVEDETNKAGTSLYAIPSLKFAELTTKLNQSSVELSAMETSIRRYLASLLIMQTFKAKIDCLAHEELFDEITRFNSTLEDLSLNLRFIQNRITLQLNVVYSLVAQRDNRFKISQHANEDDAGGDSFSSPIMSSAQPPRSPISEAPSLVRTGRDHRPPTEHHEFALAMPFDARELRTAQRRSLESSTLTLP